MCKSRLFLTIKSLAVLNGTQVPVYFLLEEARLEYQPGKLEETLKALRLVSHPPYSQSKYSFKIGFSGDIALTRCTFATKTKKEMTSCVVFYVN